ncbi:MAG: ABC transporter substrate-binding protein [Dehalococcoidia bacterium]|nr:hypothetical protein [Chloroflexota bacterium]MBT9162052.1 hypothetical protein [Chloroflexota bacterium]
MKNRIAKTVSIALALVLMLTLQAGCAVPAPAAETERLPKLILVAPPGPMAIPAAYLVVNNRLAAVAEEVELVIWANPAQIKAIVAGGQGDFVTMPSNLASIFYNKEMGVQLLDISVWNVLYLISSDPAVETLADMRGETIAVPFKGAMPDLMLQILSERQGIDPLVDFDLNYVADPMQAAQLLLAGVVEHAVIAEPLATTVVLQTGDQPRRLYRAIRFDAEWARVVGEEIKTPIAGTVALSRIQHRPDVIDEFIRQYRLAVEWMLENPEQAGLMAEEHLPALGFKAGPVAASLANITWDHVQARDAREDLEAFFTILMGLSPGVVGGALPDDGFYYPGADLE